MCIDVRVYNALLYSSDVPGPHMVTATLQDAMERLSVPPLSDTIESVFILGGTRVYKVTIQ